MHPIRLACVLDIVLFTVVATAATAGVQPGQSQPAKPRNLEVLSPDLSRDSVVTIMRFEVAKRAWRVLQLLPRRPRRPVRARRMLELNIREHPEAWDPVYTLAQVLETLGEKDLAIEQWR
jgi:hypothetical protein